MRYALYWRWKGETKTDSDICEDAHWRDVTIKDMKDRDDFDYIAFEPIYKSGEHGQRKTVLGTW